MIISKKYSLMLLLVILCSIHGTAQAYYYYYKGNKIPLTLNENKVVASIPKTCDVTSKRICANVQVLDSIRDSDGYFDIFIISRSDYEKLASMDSWEEDKKSVILTSCFIIDKNAEVYESPHLTVKIKKEEDKVLLASYAERYKFRIVRNIPSMPLWYIVSVTLESEKSPLQCANELYESGDFAYAVPDLVSPTIPDGIQVRGITSKTTEESSGIYDLQGRRINGKPTKGVYIESGRKTVVR